MVKLVSSVVAVSLLALPALAVSSQQYERTVAEGDLYGRDLADLDNIILTREDLDEIFGREFVTDIDERSPGFGGLLRGAKVLAKLGRKGAEHAKTAQHSKSAHRAYKVMEGVNNANDAYNQVSGNSRREFDIEEFALRAFDEDLEIREPLNLGFLAKGLGKAFHHADKVQEAAQFIPQPNQNQNQNNNPRDIDEELFERAFDDEEFFGREYFDDLD